MVEAILVISNLLFGISILTYFYFREIRHRNDEQIQVRDLQSFYREQINSTNQYNIEREKGKDSLITSTFSSYLKHIQSLEKMSVPKTPTQVNKETVANIMQGLVPNEIEETDEDMEQKDFQEMINKVGLTHDTKVGFEEGGPQIPNEIEEEILG